MEKEIKREELLQKAMPKLLSEGIKDLNVHKLKREYALSDEQFKQLFQNKEDFLKQALEIYLQSHKEAYTTILHQEQHVLKQVLHIISHQAVQAQHTHPAFHIQLQYLYPRIWSIYQQHSQNYLYHLLYDLLNEGIRLRSFRQDINLEVVTKVLMEQVNILLNQCLFPANRYNLSEVFRGIFLYYLEGISTEAGKKELECIFTNFSL